MKIIEFPYEDKGAGLYTVDGVELPLVNLLPETSLVRAKEPLFLPEWYTEWVGHVYTGVTIGRLGRCIDSRFAQNYISGRIIAIHAMPANGFLSSGHTSAAVAGCDGCLLKGAAPDGGGNFTLHVEKLFDKEEIFRTEIKIDDFKEDAERSIELSSRTFTLHTGDVILFKKIYSMPLTPETRVILNQGQEVVLSHKIK